MKEKKAQLVTELSKTSGVSEADVQKVLEKLGFSQALKNVKSLGGEEPLGKVTLANTKVAFKVGRNGLVV